MILPMVRSKVNPASRREGDATYKLFQTVQFFYSVVFRMLPTAAQYGRTVLRVMKRR